MWNLTGKTGVTRSREAILIGLVNDWAFEMSNTMSLPPFCRTALSAIPSPKNRFTQASCAPQTNPFPFSSRVLPLIPLKPLGIPTCYSHFVLHSQFIKLYEIFTGIIDIDKYPMVRNNTAITIIQMTKTTITAILLIKACFKDVQNFCIITTLTAKKRVYTGLVFKENMLEINT